MDVEKKEGIEGLFKSDRSDLEEYAVKGGKYFNSKYPLRWCLNNPRTAGIMNLHIYGRIEKTNELLKQIINLLDKERTIEKN